MSYSAVIVTRTDADASDTWKELYVGLNALYRYSYAFVDAYSHQDRVNMLNPFLEAAMLVKESFTLESVTEEQWLERGWSHREKFGPPELDRFAPIAAASTDDDIPV